MSDIIEESTIIDPDAIEFDYRELRFRRTADGGAETTVGGYLKLRYWPVADPGLGDRWRYDGITSRIVLTGHREMELMQFSHPTELGCRIGIYKAAVEMGAIPIPTENSHLDDKDAAILAAAVKARQMIEKPAVGDVVRMPGGIHKRIAYDWDDSYQLCDGGSFYLNRNGTGSMSGGLDLAIGAEHFKPTDEIQFARFWFFHHGFSGAGRGVNVMVPCRVWACEVVGNG